MSKEEEIKGLKKGHHKRHRWGHQKLEKVILIGNPNVGKSIIFGLLTGKYVTVSNYPGTTVEISYGNITVGDKKYFLVDSPGVNTLTPMSEDEKVTRDLLLQDKPSLVILVGDAKNLKRTLMLLIQISEMDLPCILNLNMEDEAKDRGIAIDYQKLSALLGTKIIGTVAPQKKGIEQLRASITTPLYPSIRINYGDVIEGYIKKIAELLPMANISKRSIALMILSNDETIKEWLIKNIKTEAIREIEELRDEAQTNLKEPLSNIISHGRINIADELCREVLNKNTSDTGLFAQRLSEWTMHPMLGILFLLFVLFGFYEFVGKFGAGTLVDFLKDVIFNRYLTPAIEKTVKVIIPVSFIQDMLVGPYGIFTMALTYAIGIILPITTTFFLTFGFLEDSGYLPRLAVISNKLFKSLGLNGKAILPLVLGLGCGTMATMTTRILETKRERIIATFLIALTIPCSAQIGVIFGMLGSLHLSASIWWAGTITTVLIFSGYLASKLVQGEQPDFFMELPPMRFPAIGNILMKTLSRIEWYLKEAVPLFVLGTLTLFLLDRMEILKWIDTVASPIVVHFLGLPAKATEAFLMGFLRRDYGAAGLFDLQRQGLLNENQVIVSLVTMTLFVPCLANFFMIIKERGIKTSLLMIALIIPFALLVGGILNFILNLIT